MFHITLIRGWRSTRAAIALLDLAEDAADPRPFIAGARAILEQRLGDHGDDAGDAAQSRVVS